ncbi:MAG TPA: DUF2158 domain-containing protein [Methylocella sp.]|nr:DUF2158 domain-containing protein [Methylocella sp.]
MTEPFAFEPGDIVMLKSGGPAMTVMSASEDGVLCMWYAEDAEEMKTVVAPASCFTKVAVSEDEYEYEFEDEDGEEEEERRGV